MNIAAAADRRRVAKVPGDLLDGAHHRLLALAFGFDVAEAPQRFRRQLRAGPGAEIFRGDVLARDLAQIGVNLFRPDRVLVALVVQVLGTARSPAGRGSL